MIFINNDIESTLQVLEENLEETSTQIESFQKEILFKIITEKDIARHIKRQRRINAIKSPFIKARNVLQGILGENIEEIREEELLDLSSLDEEHNISRDIVSTLNYPACIEYLNDVLKNNLIKANKTWRKDT